MKFTPSPTKIVRVVDKEGNLIKEVPMNRARRRKLRIGKAK
jgi:hypothetical protein